MDWFQIGKGEHQGCILHRVYLTSMREKHIMWNAGLDEIEAGIKKARENTNNLRYADDTTIIRESKEKIKSLLMKVKGKVKKLA